MLWVAVDAGHEPDRDFCTLQANPGFSSLTGRQWSDILSQAIETEGRRRS